MSSKHELRVSAQYSSEGEFWKVEVLDDGNVIASADRLPDSAKAREAGEYLSFAIGDKWRLLHTPSDQAIAASVDAVKSEIETEVAQDPASDGFMYPGRLLRKIFRVIRLEQARELHRDDDAAAAARSESGWQWALRMGRPQEMPKAEANGRWNSPQRIINPDLRYVILELSDAKALALNASAGFDERVARVLGRLEAETGSDVEDIVAQLKALEPCGACVHESMERYCVCWRGNRLGRRIARLVDRANADRS